MCRPAVEQELDLDLGETAIGSVCPRHGLFSSVGVLDHCRVESRQIERRR